MVMLENSHFDQGWEIIKSQVSKLRSKGITQYRSEEHLFNLYTRRFYSGTPMGIFCADELAGIVILTITSSNEDWSIFSEKPFVWLSTLFTNPKFAHQGVGAALINSAISYAAEHTWEILLDCSCESGFLEPYYRDLGFETIEKKVNCFDDFQFTSALMRYRVLQ